MKRPTFFTKKKTMNNETNDRDVRLDLDKAPQGDESGVIEVADELPEVAPKNDTHAGEICAACKGRGLRDSSTLCSECGGAGVR